MNVWIAANAHFLICATAIINGGMLITPLHCRTARLLLGWDQTDLVGPTQLSIITIRRFESSKEVSDNVRQTIQQALEKAGAVFFFAGDRVGPDLTVELGVVIRKRRAKRSSA